MNVSLPLAVMVAPVTTKLTGSAVTALMVTMTTSVNPTLMSATPAHVNEGSASMESTGKEANPNRHCILCLKF